MAAPGANPPFTLANTIFGCGITNTALFGKNTKTSRIATELFDDNFTSYIDDGLKSYSTLTAAEGHIRLTPGYKKNMN